VRASFSYTPRQPNRIEQKTVKKKEASMRPTVDAPLFTVQSVVQGLASDSALLLSLVTTVERTATAEQKAAFVRHFVWLLLHCRDEGVFAGSELLSELFILDLDEAMWRQRDAAVFLRRPGTIVSSLLDQLSRETFSSPEGSLLPHLVAATRVLSAGDDAADSSIATPMGVSPGQWSHPSEEGGPLASATQLDGMNVYDHFSTSELAGLSTAEQQFFSDPGHSPFFVNSFFSSVGGGTGMKGSRPPLQPTFSSPSAQQQQQQQQRVRGVSPYGFPDNSPSAGGAWRDSFRYTRDTEVSNDNVSRPPTRTSFTGVQMREAVDFFSEAAAMTDSKSVPNAELALNVVDVRAEAVLALAFQIQEVVSKHISDCPLVLRRSFWLWLRAASGRSGPPESAEISPELPVAAATAERHTPLLHLLSSSSAVKSSSPSSSVSFEFVGMATMVVLHMLTPLLLSIPSFVLPVEEDEDSEAYVTTTARFRFMAKLLQKAAYGVLFDERYEAGLTPLNRGMRELHLRWVSCFSALADYRNASSMNWCCPLPSPTRGLAISLTSMEEEQTVLQQYFQLLDGFLVPYLQTTVLLRRFTEAIHLPQWLRCTYFGARFSRGLVGGVCASAPLPSPQVTSAVVASDPRASGGVTASADATAASKEDPSEEEKLLRMGRAISHVVAGLSNATCTDTTKVVSAFMANFVSFLGTSSAKVSTIVVYEDLLRRYWAQFPPSDKGGDTMSVSVGKAEAAAVLAFYVYLAVQHNVVSPRFQLVLIPSVSAALRAEGQQRRLGSSTVSTTDTLQWIWQVFEGVPVSYRRHCDRIWTAAIASGEQGLEAEQQQQQQTFASAASHMPQLKICNSFSELMACLFKGLSSYIPLSADDYHWMVHEQQQQQRQRRRAVSLSGNAAQGNVVHGNAEQPRNASVAEATAAPPAPHRSAVSSALANTATLRSLRARWRRPLAVSESLSASGILPLHSTRGLFEVLCTITCRRLWTDGTLQPVAGVTALASLVQPLCSIAQLYGTAADVASTLLVAVDATPPPRWLRDLQFSHGSVSVHVEGTGASPTSPGTSPTIIRLIDQVHWPHCGWFNFADTDAAEEGSSKEESVALNTQWESLMQHILFFSSEFDANVPDYDTDSNLAEQILSTRWGLCHDDNNSSNNTDNTNSVRGLSSGSSPTSVAGGGSGHATETTTLTSLHAVPSLRHLSIESLWRLFLFNVRQTCHIMRRMTPLECPFCRMEGAINDVLRGGSAIRKSPTVAVRPGFEESNVSMKECISQAAADALRSCCPSEVTVVRLIVSVAAYIRNVHTVVGRLRESGGAAVPDWMTHEFYKVVSKNGTAQLLYGKEPLTAAQERLVDLLCFDGESFIQKAYLPYYENCTWHPYGRLLYDC
jgi:hypothetical protein